MKTLTRAEEQVMQVLWAIGPAFLRDIVDAMPQPRPHQNTVATLLKILIEKEFATVNIIGRQHQYYALIQKEAYSKSSMKKLVKGYFDGSFSNVVSFMVRENSISIQDLEGIIKQIKQGKKSDK